jgi:hypothetical protein
VLKGIGYFVLGKFADVKNQESVMWQSTRDGLCYFARKRATLFSDRRRAIRAIRATECARAASQGNNDLRFRLIRVYQETECAKPEREAVS